MNFFTPKLLERLQERSDERSFLAASGEWEQAVEDYRAQLLRVSRKLPAELKNLCDEVCLHDAHVLDMWWGGRSQFTITLHPESDPSRLVILTYSLVRAPAVEQDVLRESARSEPVAWLYDELDFGANRQRDEPVFMHRILLSDGREVRLQFRDVSVRRPVPLVPVVPTKGLNPASVRHSA
jgi:hypothetical protein